LTGREQSSAKFIKKNAIVITPSTPRGFDMEMDVVVDDRSPRKEKPLPDPLRLPYPVMPGEREGVRFMVGTATSVNAGAGEVMEKFRTGDHAHHSCQSPPDYIHVTAVFIPP
jgi:hypothetical protein